MKNYFKQLEVDDFSVVSKMDDLLKDENIKKIIGDDGLSDIRNVINQLMNDNSMNQRYFLTSYLAALHPTLNYYFVKEKAIEN